MIRSLQLRNNNLNGSLPVELQLLVSVSVLDLSCNRLTGVLPAQLFGGALGALGISSSSKPVDSGCRRIVHLDLSENELTGDGKGGEIIGGGVLDSALASLSQLKVFNLSKNRFTGPLPSCFDGHGWIRLTLLDLSRQKSEPGFTGIRPVGLSRNCLQLTRLNLAGNGFEGDDEDSKGAYASNLARRPSWSSRGTLLVTYQI